MGIQNYSNTQGVTFSFKKRILCYLVMQFRPEGPAYTSPGQVKLRFMPKAKYSLNGALGKER
jgi:hypothetical protein